MTVLLHAGGVTLRPFLPEEFDVLWIAETTDRGAFDAAWDADDRRARQRVRARVERSGTWRDDRVLDLAVDVDGRLAGDIQARRDPGHAPPGLFDVGIGLFAEQRGHGIGTTAVELLTAHLFDGERAMRVSLSTDVDNTAMRRAAEKAGFALEGIMRGFWYVADGRPRDYALYARTRADHEGR